MDNVLLDILKLCRAIDERSAAIYAEFLSETSGPEADFWDSMADDERVHANYWKYMIELCEEGAVGKLFDDPDRVLAELVKIRPRIEELVFTRSRPSHAQERLSIACHLEFFMLHRSFISLFCYVDSISREGKKPARDYELHLEKFVDSIERYGGSPELKLSGDIILRMWTDNKNLVVQNNSDVLTGVYNRNGFFQTAMTLAFLAQRGGKSVAVLLLDADDFKQINDLMGHKAGDEALKILGAVLKKHTRHSDIVGRYGGEEFLVLLADITADGVKAVAEEIRAAVEKESAALSRPFTVSIGAVTGKLGTDVEKDLYALVAKADGLMYEAKGRGKNRVCMGS
ncbi:MAG: GGDEF domain-containing protein [Deltaproteobacteria bacterium]|nr:GGDEF domain-containing protein [Deltaproteobacteria bacterium]